MYGAARVASGRTRGARARADARACVSARTSLAGDAALPALPAHVRTPAGAPGRGLRVDDGAGRVESHAQHVCPSDGRADRRPARLRLPRLDANQRRGRALAAHAAGWRPRLRQLRLRLLARAPAAADQRRGGRRRRDRPRSRPQPRGPPLFGARLGPLRGRRSRGRLQGGTALRARLGRGARHQ